MINKKTGEEYSTKDWISGSIVLFFAIIGLINSVLFVIRLITGK